MKIIFKSKIKSVVFLFLPWCLSFNQFPTAITDLLCAFSVAIFLFLSLPLPSIYFMTLSILLDFQIGFILCLSNLLNESVNSILIVSYLTSLTCESISRFISFNSTTIFKKINVARIRYRLSFEKLFFYCRFKCFVSLFQSQ